MNSPLLRPRAGLFRLVTCCILTAAGISRAEDVVWDFATASPLSQPANLTVSAVTQGNNNGTTIMLSGTSASSGYPGASGGNNAGAAARTGAYQPDQSAYFEVTLTPAANFRVTVTDVKFGSRSTTTGPAKFDIRSSADGYIAAATAATAAASGTWGPVSRSGLSIVSATGLTLRIYGVDGTGSASANTANWRIDDLKLSVIVSPEGTPVPTVDSVTPSSGSVGNAVTITGTNFGASPLVWFNGTLTAGSTVNPDGTSISTTVPAGATTGTVTVTTNDGAATSPQPFTVIPLPALTVVVSPASFPENAASPAASGTVSIPAALTEPLTVTLASGTPAAATVSPLSVVIPAGEFSVGFTVDAVANPASFANNTSLITATANGHDPGSFTVTATNIDAIPTSVVINKYLNGTPDMVELLVIGTGIAGSTADLRRMLIKDHSASMGSDGGGKFRFKNDGAAAALFSAVKAGTLIVLSNSATSADTDPSDFVVRLGLTDAAYFASEGGTFDIATTEMVMIKAPDALPAGGVGAVHTLAGGTAGTQFNDAPPKKLLAAGTSGTGLGVVANNTTGSLADYDGTDATGAVTLSAAAFGLANNNANNAYIRSLRGIVSVDGAGTATITNGDGASPASGRNFFPRNTPGQIVSLSLLSNVTDAPLTSVKFTVPAGFGVPDPGNITVSPASAFSVTGQDVTVTGAAITNVNGVVITVAGLTTPNPSALTDDGRYTFDIQTAGDGGTLTSIASQPAALVAIPVASLRDIDANGLPLDLNKTVAIEAVCTEEDFDATGHTSAFVQDGASGINVFIRNVELNLTRGSRYAITGQIIQFSGLTEISPAGAADVINLGAAAEPAPLTITVPDLLANAEAYEGRLIKVVALQYVSGTWGASASVAAADGSANPLDVRIQSGSAALTPPAWPITVTGIFGQFDSTLPYTTGWQIMPRTDADVESLGGGVGYDGWAAAYPGIGGPEDDGDGDGASNLLEYAAGSIPNSSKSLPQSIQSEIGATLTVVWAKGATAAADPALTWIIEASPDMSPGSWSTSGVLNFLSGPTSVSADYAITPGTKVFLRLKVVRTL